MMTEHGAYLHCRCRRIVDSSFSFVCHDVYAIFCSLQFINGEFINSCLLLTGEEMCPEKMDLFRSVSLSARTTVGRTDIWSYIKNQLRDKAKIFLLVCFCSWRVDRHYKCYQMAGCLAIEATEDYGSINSVHGTTVEYIV